MVDPCDRARRAFRSRRVSGTVRAIPDARTCRLAGTLTVPAGDEVFPAVVFVAGSGGVDRDENRRKMKINSFSELAHRFAGRGCAFFRFGKRGVGGSEGQYLTTGFHDNVRDPEAAVRALHHHGCARRQGGSAYTLGRRLGGRVISTAANHPINPRSRATATARVRLPTPSFP